MEHAVDVIDIRVLDQLQELIGGDRGELVELVNTFVEEGSDIVKDMHAALSANDAELLRRSAHSLKANAQDFGASKLSTLCASLESACKLTIPEQANSQVGEIDRQFEDARDELKRYTTI